MNPLQSRLAGLRRRLKFVTLMRGVSLLCIVILGSIFLSGLLDWTVHLPAVIRAMLLVGILGGTAVIVYRFLLAPLAERSDDLALALRVEEEYPVLNDALASTVQFLNLPKDTPAAGSASMRGEAIQRSLRLVQGCDFNKVVNAKGLRITGGLAAAIAIGAVFVALWFPSIVRPAVLRLAHPFGEYDWETKTQLKLEYDSRIAMGQPFKIVGSVTGKIPSHATIEFDGLDRSEVARDYSITLNKTESQGTFTAKLDMTGQENNFRFRVQANDARSPRREGRWHTVRVGRPPNLIAVNGKSPPYMTLYPPAYADLPSPRNVPPGTWQVEAFEGTWFHLEASTDQPIAKAWIQYRPADGRQQFSSELGLIGHANPLSALAVHVGSKEGFARLPALIDGDGTHFSIDFRPWLSGTYVIHIEDAEQLPNEFPLILQITPDPAPVVHLKRPATNLSLLPDATITLRVAAEDETFAIRSMYLEYWRKDAKGRLIDADKRRVPLYDHQVTGATASQLMAGLSAMPMQLPLPMMRLRTRYLDVERRWSLEGLVKKGDIVVIQACADDFNDVVAFNIPGRSHQIELRIVDAHELDAFLDKEQAKIHQNLLRLREWQNQALKKTIKADEQLKNTGKLRDEDIKALMEAEQLQKQIHARIGETKDEGLRKELARLKQMIKDNKIDSSGAKDRVEAMKKELERIARENLPQITPRLSNARQKADAALIKKKDPDPKVKDDLAKAKQNQQEVQQAIDDLLKHLDRWADFQELKGEVRATMNEQVELKNDTEKISKNYEPDDPQWRAELQRIAELQNRLSDKSQRLINKLKRVAEEKTKTDPQMAKRLKNAAKVGEDGRLPQEIKDTKKQLELAVPEFTPLPERMQDVARNLRQKQVNKAISQQNESLKTLKEMVKAMQENRDDELERLVKKQDKAKKDLDEIVERLEKLQKKVKDAQQIANPEERKKALQKLADEQRQLQNDAQDKARDMAGMRADDAGRELRKAADQMEKALKRLEEGENPEEQQQEALERLQQAQEKLDQAQREAEEELARERLARIADHIKGLKDRQDAAIAESERIHQKILRGGWAQTGLRLSVMNHGEVQDNLADETGSLAEKLKGAKVFELILRKAGEDMTRASKAIKKRWGKSAFRMNDGDFPFDEEILKDEQDGQKRIIRYQEHARDRLQRLVNALKEELKKKRPQQNAEKNDQKKDGDGDKKKDEEKKGGLRAQDGIPALAQLKVLRAEQQDVNDRTMDFARERPNPQQWTPDDQEEMEALHADQEAIFELFRELVTSNNEKQKDKPGDEK